MGSERAAFLDTAKQKKPSLFPGNRWDCLAKVLLVYPTLPGPVRFLVLVADKPDGLQVDDGTGVRMAKMPLMAVDC